MKFLATDKELWFKQIISFFLLDEGLVDEDLVSLQEVISCYLASYDCGYGFGYVGTLPDVCLYLFYCLLAFDNFFFISLNLLLNIKFLM